jgi:acetyl-CoA synthetase (ADP-forming)
VRVSWLAADLGPRLVELEINPLIVCRAGGGALAVDARGTLATRKEPAS